MISTGKISLMEEKEVKKLFHAEDRKGLSKTFVERDTLNITKMLSNNNMSMDHVNWCYQRVFHLKIRQFIAAILQRNS